MDLSKLNPWNWFKHEQGSEQPAQVPVKRSEYPRPAPEQAFDTLQQEFDRLFENMLQRWRLPLSSHWPGRVGESFPAPGGNFSPSLNIAAEEDRYRVSVELPGLREEDVELEVSGDLLVIKGQSQTEKEDKGTHYYRIERASGRFQRTLSLPDDADAEAISASLKDGLLSVEIPRREEARKPLRKIPIGH